MKKREQPYRAFTEVMPPRAISLPTWATTASACPSGNDGWRARQEMVEPMKKRKQPYRTFTEAMPPGGSTGSQRSSAMVVGNVKQTLSCAAIMRPVSTHRLLNKSPAPHLT